MSGAPLGSMVSTVENMIKTQMQLDNISDNRFKGSWDCTKTLVQERGLRIIYMGYGVNTVREAAFLGTYFYTYEGLRTFLDCTNNKQNYSDSNLSTWTIPVAGGISGALSWFVTFPLDCIRAGIQGQRLSKIEPTVKSWGNVICSTVPVKRISSMNVFKEIHKTKGFIGLYSGVSPTLARAFIVSASRFSAYELAVKIFGSDLKS
jgi:solute carrier family 25 carnitine/acylcarnitine transporter 20/29